MDKPTKEMIQNATDEQLAEWSALWVMGWRRKVLIEPIGEEYASRDYALSGTMVDDWNPAQNIAQAFELVEKFAVFEIEKDLNEWVSKIPGLDEASRIKVIEPALGRSITKAALLAAIGG